MRVTGNNRCTDGANNIEITCQVDNAEKSKYKDILLQKSQKLNPVVKNETKFLIEATSTVQSPILSISSPTTLIKNEETEDFTDIISNKQQVCLLKNPITKNLINFLR